MLLEVLNMVSEVKNSFSSGDNQSDMDKFNSPQKVDFNGNISE